MTADFAVLLTVIVTALAFDFTNGFHDTGNAMAPAIATGALRPRVAVALSAFLNLVGAFLSVAVAATIAEGIVDLGAVQGEALMTIVFGGLVGGIAWNLLTWLLGLPSSSSHALFGGLIGAALAALGTSGIEWGGVVGKIIIPAVLSPIVAALVAAVGTWLSYRIGANTPKDLSRKGYRWGQVGSASLISLAHGTNDAQKTMGVIFLALVANGTLGPHSPMPIWVKVACAAAIAAGTYLGGWRVIRTLGKGLVDIDTPQGMAADASSAAIILTSSHLGLPLSTTHVATGSILGTGVGRRDAAVRWGVAGRMVVAWLVTLPAAAAGGALCWAVAHFIGGPGGIAVVFVLLVVLAGWIWLRSRSVPVTADNVTMDWEEKGAPVSPKTAAIRLGTTASAAPALAGGADRAPADSPREGSGKPSVTNEA